MTCQSDFTLTNRLHLLFCLAVCHLLFLTFFISSSGLSFAICYSLFAKCHLLFPTFSPWRKLDLQVIVVRHQNFTSPPIGFYFIWPPATRNT